MMLLNKEEIRAIGEEAQVDSEGQLNFCSYTCGLMDGSKAQLKNVAEWGNEFCDCDVKREHPIHRHFCPGCWLKLLKEVVE